MIIFERKRNGDDANGEESTRTRWADGVEGGTSTDVSNRR